MGHHSAYCAVNHDWVWSDTMELPGNDIAVLVNHLYQLELALIGTWSLLHLWQYPFTARTLYSTEDSFALKQTNKSIKRSAGTERRHEITKSAGEDRNGEERKEAFFALPVIPRALFFSIFVFLLISDFLLLRL